MSPPASPSDSQFEQQKPFGVLSSLNSSSIRINYLPKMKWRTTAFLFVAWTLLCLAEALNATSTTVDSAPKDANETYPYLNARSMDYNTNNQYNSYNAGPSKSRFFDFPNPAPGSNLFNTSLAFTIPLFSINTKALTDPITGGGRSFIEPLMGGFDGVGGYSGTGGFPLGSGVVAGLAIPALIAGILILLFDIFSRPFLASTVGARASDSIFSGGFTGIAEYMLTFVENSLDHVPTIDGEECIKRSVCEAHSNPKKYGIIALPLQLLFPPYPYTGTDDTSKISKYQLAARYGKNENANCGAQYHACVVNPLDLISSFARMITDI